MFACPNCTERLARVKADHGIYWSCPSCSGRLVAVALLRKLLTRDVVNRIWGFVRERVGAVGRPCPACHHHMLEVAPAAPPGEPALDVCRVCHLVWFDPNEFEVLPKLPRNREEDESPLIRQAAALMKVYAERERQRDATFSGENPAAWWHYLPALLGMPVEKEGHEISQMPILTWSLGLAIVLVCILTFRQGLEQVIMNYGLIPSEAGRLGGLTFLTSFFLHAGVFHLLGNLYFLLMVGDNVEDYLGHVRFLILLGAASLAGDLLHILADPNSDIPMVGASGGISGLMAFYALKFPHIRLGFFLAYFFIWRWIQMPAYVAFIIWIILQFVTTGQQLAGLSEVSGLAHLGGAAVGFVFWLALRNE